MVLNYPVTFFLQDLMLSRGGTTVFCGQVYVTDQRQTEKKHTLVHAQSSLCASQHPHLLPWQLRAPTLKPRSLVHILVLLLNSCEDICIFCGH